MPRFRPTHLLIIVLTLCLSACDAALVGPTPTLTPLYIVITNTPTVTPTPRSATLVPPTSGGAIPSITPAPPIALQQPLTEPKPPSDLVQHLTWSGGGGGSGGTSYVCWEPGEIYGVWRETLYATDNAIEIVNLSDFLMGNSIFQENALFAPAICGMHADITQGAIAISPKGISLPAMARTGLTAQPDYESISTVWLPLEAYAEPGLWTLKLSDEHPFELKIHIPPADVPARLDDARQMLFLGFKPFERIRLVIAPGSSEEPGWTSDLVIQADANGNALTDFQTAMIAVGSQGTIYVNPILEIVESNGNARSLSADEHQAIFNYYWGVQSATTTCPGAPASRLTIGDSGRVTITNGIPVNVRNTPSRSATILFKMAEATRFTIMSGPECANNWTWWEILAEDGRTGWIAEGDQNGYFIEPYP